ncbi:LodA/GoxA family CTQ-dependent oxidase [Roseivirga sp. BDSF3-8]|uniref:LodA/GoxA family CTQ-dependent oxidase n=1 Tax=Roseivirga sp. BDSF3-8 TaxID=3241598 RepID=UPI0035321D61
MKFRIYPSIGIARVGNSQAKQNDVVFAPEVPWANLFDTDQEYLSDNGALRKQAQRFYIYECDDNGKPVRKIDPNQYDIEWTAEVANKKPFWYDFNNSLDLSVQTENRNLSPNFFNDKIAPGIGASLRNPNVLNNSLRVPDNPNFRKELVNNPPAVSVSAAAPNAGINGSFPNPGPGNASLIAAEMNTTAQPVSLGSLEYDAGTLIFYPADGISASLNPSDLNTDFADNSNWYDDICDGRITAKITDKNSGQSYDLSDPSSAAWVATAPPDYAPQIQPIATMYDLICGASADEFRQDFSTVFPVFYRLYRMQWVNAGDFLSPSFKEVIDKLTASGNFRYLYDQSEEGKTTRETIFNMFRNPQYDYTNEPIIPSKSTTDLKNLGSGTEELKLPFYPGDGINYPGSPAQWFAIPPLLYDQLIAWRDGKLTAPEGTFNTIDELGVYYQGQFSAAAQDEGNSALLMTRAVLETLYGGGFHPGVELTWPMRHAQMYSQNTQVATQVGNAGLFGLREIRINATTAEEQEAYFYNSFGLYMNADDVKASMDPANEESWLWKITPGDMTKWMGIPWQSDAGSCQLVFMDSQYPVPAWWAANLPTDVLTEESLVKMQNDSVTEETRRSIFANRLPWLKTTDTGFVGYHAEGGYQNGLIAMVYQWKDIGVVMGRKSNVSIDGVPETVYVSFDSKNKRDRAYVFLGMAIAGEPVINSGDPFYTNTRNTIYIPQGKSIMLSSKPDGSGDIYVDDEVEVFVNGNSVYQHDFSNNCSGVVTPLSPQDLTAQFSSYAGNYVTLQITYSDRCGGSQGASNFYLVFK